MHTTCTTPGVISMHLPCQLTKTFCALTLFIALIFSSMNPASARPAKSGEAKAYAKTYMSTKYNWAGKQYSCLVSLWEYESHWNYKSRSKKYFGIGQLNKGFIHHSGYSKKQYLASYKIQVRVGLKYIKSRYGTPCKANKHRKHTGWY